ncbi:conserved hypothetical protein [Burkholderiales bacterium 8X]|nr:conserved hypothetical protein [Burkholderiales bacterium 8X]
MSAAPPERPARMPGAQRSSRSRISSSPVESLSDFQRAFANALRAASQAPAPGDSTFALVQQPAFEVYRNTVAKACIDALAANFPTVLRLVGDAWFRQAAALHVQASPPIDGRLLFYGAAFPSFLDSFEPAAELGYLAGVARVDAAWIDSHTAPSAPALDAALLARISQEELAERSLRPHPAARWLWFDGQPIASIWSRNRTGPASEMDAPAELSWQPEGILLTRPQDAVVATALALPDHLFLAQCASGRVLGEVAETVLDTHPEADLAGIFERLLLAGAFEASPCAAAIDALASPDWTP